jgi:hypothetical protein
MHNIFKTAKRYVPFLTPTSPCGTSTFCWRFSLLAVICRPFQQLADIYVVVFQFSHGDIHCRNVRSWTSVRHIKIRCKEKISCCQIYILCCGIAWNMAKDMFSYFAFSSPPQALTLQYVSLYSLPRLFIISTNTLCDHTLRCVAVRTGWYMPHRGAQEYIGKKKFRLFHSLAFIHYLICWSGSMYRVIISLETTKYCP